MNLVAYARFLLVALGLCSALPAALSAPASEVPVAHSPRQPRSGEDVVVTAATGSAGGSATLEYQVVLPGAYIELKEPAYRTNWTRVAMRDDGSGGDLRAGDGIFTTTLPGALQQHRRLVRYRIVWMDPQKQTNRIPAAEAAVANFAYFVYDGVPKWQGAIEPRSNVAARRTPTEFSADVMRSLPVYHLLGRKRSIENATWNEQHQGKEYLDTGTLVYDGEVYDHIRYRARGGVWRYAMGKNMWKIDFNKGHPLEASDDYGRPYEVKWTKLNLRACIDQADYGMRGNQGMFEAVGFRLFNLSGVEAPSTHWVQLRIVDEVEESPSNQYRGDFWGLYLAIENEDGRFLKRHHLPDGNLYKMEWGGGTLQNHGEGAVTNQSDLKQLVAGYSGRASETWWRTNVDLPRYYSYRSIIECIHHYDVDQGAGKNYDFFFNPESHRWQAIPWDIDLTWADYMYGGGDEPFHRRVLSYAALKLEYQNRLREIRDLLYNTNQAWQLIDECAAILAAPGGGPSIVGADRAKWDFHPVMAMGGKAGQGLFYQAAATKDFAGMVQLMKDYVRTRGRWIDSALLRDPSIPARPTLRDLGPPGHPPAQLQFASSAFQGSNSFARIQWRLAEVAAPVRTAGRLTQPGVYEIQPLWESAEKDGGSLEISLPADRVQSGHTYRVRARMEDKTGRWGHWSAPVEFSPGR